MRRMLAILGLAVLAGCDDKDYLEEVVTVTVVNQEPESVYGRAEGWDDDEGNDFSLSAGASGSSEIWVEKRLKVSIWRSSDSLLLFSGSWNAKELRNLDERVTITLAP